MATVQHLKVEDLTKDEQDLLAKCEEQLKDLKFVPSDAGYDVCDEPQKLNTAAAQFITIFAPWKKFGGRGSRLQALRFDKSAKLPVPGSMLFIPTVVTGIPTISGQVLGFGTYVQLTKDVVVEPGVYCLAFLAN